VLALVGWTALLAFELRADPHAANDSWRLLSKSTFADGRQYVPGLFIRTWADAAPGLLAQLAAWGLLVGAATWWVTRAAADRDGDAASAAGAQDLAGEPRPGGAARGSASPPRVLASVAATLLVAAFVLERASPLTRSGPAWPGELKLSEHSSLFLEGDVTIREDEAVVGPGAVELVLRAPESRESVGLTLGGAGGFARPAGRPPQALRPSGAFIEMPLSAYHVVRGRGRNAAFSRGDLWLDEQAVLRPSSMEPGAREVR
jgi:hypothetical protein